MFLYRSHDIYKPFFLYLIDLNLIREEAYGKLQRLLASYFIKVYDPAEFCLLFIGIADEFAHVAGRRSALQDLYPDDVFAEYFPYGADGFVYLRLSMIRFWYAYHKFALIGEPQERK